MGNVTSTPKVVIQKEDTNQNNRPVYIEDIVERHSLLESLNKNIKIIPAVFTLIISGYVSYLFIEADYFSIDLIMIIISGIALLIFLLGNFYLYYFKDTQPSTPKKSDLDKGFELLLNVYNNKTLNKESIMLIYDRIIKNTGMSLVDFLESFLINIMQKDSDGSVTTAITDIFRPILKNEKAEKPYPNLNEPTRHILIEIEKSANSGEIDSLKGRLDDLYDDLINKQKSLNNTKRVNLSLTILSLILTVAFGVIGLRNTILSEKDITKTPQQESQEVIKSVNDKESIISTNAIDSVCVKEEPVEGE